LFLVSVQPGTDDQRHPGLLLLEAEAAIEVGPFIGEKRHVMAGNAFEQSSHDSRPKALAPVSGCGPDVNEPSVADPVGKQAGG
jgi:hypothetical protein